MSVGDLVFAALTGDSVVNGQVATRVYANRLPQGPRPADYKAIVYSVVADVPANAVTGNAASRLRGVRVQVDCYSKLYDDGQIVADAVADVAAAPAPGLNGWVESRRDLYDDEAELHRVMMELDLWV